jgi:hypothetical protein
MAHGWWKELSSKTPMKAVSALVVTAVRLKQEDDLGSSLSLSILVFELKCQDLTIIHKRYTYDCIYSISSLFVAV